MTKYRATNKRSEYKGPRGKSNDGKFSKSKKFYEKEDESSFIYGVRSVIEAVRSQQEINKILIQKGMDKELFYELKDVLADKKYFLQFVPAAKINRITQKNHQGVVAFISPIKYQKIHNVLPKIYESGKSPNILVLDRITDVRNFGAIARTASCMGVDTIIIPKKESVMINADAIKTSAGALNNISVCREDNLIEALQFLKENGVSIVACSEKSNLDLFDADLVNPTAIIMGSEKDGISERYIKMSDLNVKIPIVGHIHSLNVGVATGMILMEKFRQLM